MLYIYTSLYSRKRNSHEFSEKEKITMFIHLYVARIISVNATSVCVEISYWSFICQYLLNIVLKLTRNGQLITFKLG